MELTKLEIKEKGTFNKELSNLIQDVWDYNGYRLIIGDCGYCTRIIKIP